MLKKHQASKPRMESKLLHAMILQHNPCFILWPVFGKTPFGKTEESGYMGLRKSYISTCWTGHLRSV